MGMNVDDLLDELGWFSGGIPVEVGFQPGEQPGEEKVKTMSIAQVKGVTREGAARVVILLERGLEQGEE